MFSQQALERIMRVIEGRQQPLRNVDIGALLNTNWAVSDCAARLRRALDVKFAQRVAAQATSDPMLESFQMCVLLVCDLVCKNTDRGLAIRALREMGSFWGSVLGGAGFPFHLREDVVKTMCACSEHDHVAAVPTVRSLPRLDDVVGGCIEVLNNNANKNYGRMVYAALRVINCVVHRNSLMAARFITCSPLRVDAIVAAGILASRGDSDELWKLATAYSTNILLEIASYPMMAERLSRSAAGALPP